MISVKNRIVQYPLRYRLTLVSGTTDVYDLTPVTGTITEVGTPINKALFDSLKNKRISATIRASGWTWDTDHYYQTISASGVTTSTIQDIFVTLRETPSVAQVEAYDGLKLKGGTQSTNSIKLYAYGEVNPSDIPIYIIIGGVY